MSDREAAAQAPGRTPVLVLGLGNLLCADDGLGVVAVEALRRRHVVPAGVSLVDGGTLGLALLPTLESAERVWILDAVAADAPPGTLVRLEGQAVEPALRERLSPHQIGVADLLDAMHWRDTWPAELRVLGLVPESFALDIGLSPAVAAGLEALVVAAVEELAAAGHLLRPRTGGPDDPLAGAGDPAARALGL
jgi:hydrogenase maturation protease